MTDTDQKRERYQTDLAARERMLAYNREWRRQNAEKVQAQRARYRDRYREVLRDKGRSTDRREYRRQYRAENADKVNERERAKYRENPARREYKRRHAQAWLEANMDYYREVQRSYRERNARVISSRATNGRTRWTEAELRIALDPTLTLAEAALMLGRTLTAVGQKRHKARRAAS